MLRDRIILPFVLGTAIGAGGAEAIQAQAPIQETSGAKVSVRVVRASTDIAGAVTGGLAGIGL